MDVNVGGYDRIARIVIGAILAIVGIAMVAEIVEFNLWVGVAAIVVGAILLVTGAVQRCPINQVVGVNTAK